MVSIIELLTQFSSWVPTNWWYLIDIVVVMFIFYKLLKFLVRRMVIRFGRAPFFRYITRTTGAQETIEEIVVATTLLSDSHRGAIMAVERDVGLRGYIESGIRLDAALTYDLLVTIFQSGSPLHDGAVIIREGRLAAAACFLPLTVNPGLGRDLGTRHRAAIGLTEENDAIAVIVSEETGQVSLALEGRIERDLSADKLRARLKTLVLTRRESPSRKSSWRVNEL
ncbi:uncharacterized protein METZ01_LOCUS14874 [marine metagenome]|uniref:DAC domain-containing protein n=1 Tax=marine metagenome TaxID=408172 RepID=A0A381P560_9ZZZZ